MPLLTINAQVIADEASQAILLDAMLCATKVYNGLLWQLRQEFEQTGKTDVSLKHLNALLKLLPRSKAYYSLSVQATRDEVIEAYRSFFALRAAGRTQHNAPGFRPKTTYSGLRYYDGYGFNLEGDVLTLSLGLSREDGVRYVSMRLHHREKPVWKRVVNVLLTYDKRSGLCAHLVVEVDAGKPQGTRKVAVDLGETFTIAAMFDDGRGLLMNGRLIKAIRRYWQKVRAKLQASNSDQRTSRRWRQVERTERLQVKHLLHLLTSHFIKCCYEAGVDTIAIGNLTGIRERIDYGRVVNQRLHAWPYAKITDMLRYKAALHGIQVVLVNEAYSSQKCYACGKCRPANRVSRGQYRCRCGWSAQADINGAANLFETAFQVSPLQGASGCVTTPVVQTLWIDAQRFVVCEPATLSRRAA